MGLADRGRPPVMLMFTRRELNTVWHALLNVADDLDDFFVDPRDKAAFRRALTKVREEGRYKLGV